MTLEVFTAPIGTRDPDAMDITRGSPFAPSPEIEDLMRRAQRAATRVRTEAARLEAREEGSGTAPRRQADEGEAMAWAAFEQNYTAEMRVSYGLAVARYGALERAAAQHGARPNRSAWDALLAKPRVVLVDSWPDPARAARRVLARILARCGAIDRGELPALSPPGVRRDIKPDNIIREDLTGLVMGLRVVVEEWRDLA